MTYKAPDHDTLQRWMKIYLATLIGESVDSLDTSDPLSEYDLDSIDAVTMAIEMEQKFDIEVHPETFLASETSILEISNQFCQ
ncbi:acyl carrier protein [Pseudophaeobacter sp.]|uniref:acyl carrier protein n=1 Tax=Pseudophaeobacter sp. TaxID=1971739 RepID=UPI0032976467